MDSPDCQNAVPQRPSSTRAVRFLIYGLVALALAVWWCKYRTAGPEIYSETEESILPLGQMHRAVYTRDEKESNRRIAALVERWRDSDDISTLHAISWGQNVLASRTGWVPDSIKLYDEVIQNYGEMSDAGIQFQVSGAFYGKAKLTENRADKPSLLDAVIDDFGERLPIDSHGWVLLAMREKARMSDDAGEAAIYDTMIERYKNAQQTYFKNLLSDVIDRRLELMPDGPEAITQIDRLAEKLDGSYTGDRIGPKLLMAKAGLTSDDQQKKEVYESIAKKYGGNSDADFFVTQALMAEVETSDRPADKIAALDQALAVVERESDDAQEKPSFGRDRTSNTQPWRSETKEDN